MTVYLKKACVSLTELPQIPEWPGNTDVQGAASDPFFSESWAYEALGVAMLGVMLCGHQTCAPESSPILFCIRSLSGILMFKHKTEMLLGIFFFFFFP